MKHVGKLVDAVLAVLLLGMVVMVFGNVVLRYVFNSGIVVSEELSRFFFVWLTFIGAIVIMREGGHIAVDGGLHRFGPVGQWLGGVFNHLIVFGCCAMLFWGTWEQHEINATNAAPVTGISMIWVFGFGYLVAVGIGLQALWDLLRLLVKPLSGSRA